MKKLILLVILLCLAIPVFAGFKSPTTPNQPLIIESNRYFYGSDSGVINMDLNLINPNNVDYDLYLNITNLYDYGVRIARFKDNGNKSSLEEGKLKSKNKLKIKKNSASKIEITFNYNPEIIGFGKKFNIELLNDAGVMIADLDPFLSGYGYRRPLTITTPADQNGYKYAQINLIVDTNTLINASKLKSDCNDLRITYGETTPIDINVSGCATTSTSIKFVLQQKINANTNNTDYYLYYGNSTATKYPNADKNWNTLFDDFSTDTISAGDWNALGTWAISGGKAVASGGAGKYMIYKYREYELPTDSVILMTTLSERGTFSNNNSYWQFFADYSTANACGGFGFNDAYLQRVAYTPDSVGNIIKMVGGGYNDLASADSSAWTNLIMKVSGTAVTADWTGGAGNPNTVNDTAFRGIKKIGFGNHDCANEEWGKIDANYIHTISVSVGSEELAPPPIFRIDFNVYGAGTSDHLTLVSLDNNVSVYDLANQNSPFGQDLNQGHYLISFSKSGYDSNSNYFVNVDSNKTITIYLTAIPATPIFRIDFNVYGAGTSDHLTLVSLDNNVSVYDLANQNSPFGQDLNQGHYLISFSKSGYDSNSNYFVNVDSNKTITIYLTAIPATGVTGTTPPRYFNPKYEQRDSNIYYNEAQKYKQTDAEKTNETLKSMESTILIGLIIIIFAIVGGFIWLKR